MRRFLSLTAFVLAALLAGCASVPGAGAPSGPGWVTLFDGRDLNQFTKLGDANWRIDHGLLVADLCAKAPSYLVSKQTFDNFLLYAEFWVDQPANSGIFIRLSDPAKITAENSYEVNIFDTRPDPTYGTGAIVNFAKVLVPTKAGGQWNTFDVTARGPQIIVVTNGVKTAEANDGKFAKGPLALQYGSGVVKFRRVMVKPL